MKALHRSLPVVIATSIAMVVIFAVGWIPLFGGPGYEIALAAGLVLPGLVAVATALSVSSEGPSPWAAFVRGAEIAVVMSTMVFGTVLIHGLRVGFCDAGDGATLYFLGPFSGALLAGVWGAAVGELLAGVRRLWPRRLAAVVLALAAPAAGVLISLWRFYSSPMVFGFDPFFGFFSGALYDTVVSDAVDRLLTYRAGTAATIVAAGAFASMFRRRDDGRLRFTPYRHPGVAWLVVLAGAASLITTTEGARLGHWQTAQTIERQLGGRIENEHCVVIYPRSLTSDAASLLLRDCTEQAGQVGKWFDIPTVPRIKAFLFADAQQKRALMGAARTAIAKPWRGEVYLRLESFPHPIMGHEIAHVIAGEYGSGPFHIAGSYGGLLPNPGLIEGVAVAASPDDDLLTPEQWSAAMLQIGVLPPLADVFALGFLGRNSDVSYTVAGAFVTWLRATKGPYVVASWYSGESIESVANASLAMLEAQWRGELGKVHLSAQAIEVAKARFDRPGVFARKCPHAIDSLLSQGRHEASEGDCVGACEDFERVTELDPHDFSSRFGMAACLPRTTGIEAARKAYEALSADDSLPALQRDRAREAIGDLDLMEGRSREAEAIYKALSERAFDEDWLRTLDVKLRASRNPDETRAVIELLLGSPTRPPDARIAFALLGKWMAEMPSDGLPAYLIGRNLANGGLWPESAEFLDWALQRRLPEERVLSEALRMRVIVACALGDDSYARKLYGRWKALPAVPESRKMVLERRLGRCIERREGERGDEK